MKKTEYIELMQTFHKGLSVWLVQKVEMIGGRAVPVFRNGKAVYALPGGGEYVE